MDNKSLPISPADVITNKKFPTEVIEAFNELIAQNFSGRSATIRQDDLLALMKKGLNKAEIFKNHWLDVEATYRAEGWIVEYDGPAYNETYEPTFTFKKKGK